tara:strand:- start:431 stop:745 length:315 start_codon:yes stop_codon:yes gene_type:complete
MKHGNSESILSKYSIYASSDDERIQLNKKQFLKAIRYKDIDCENHLLLLADFTQLLKDAFNDDGLSFFFFCDYTKKNTRLKVSCIQDNGKLEEYERLHNKRKMQ